MTPRRGYADTPVGQVHYREAGEGPPILLLHMAESSSQQYARVLPLLAQGFRAIAMDSPGCGASDPLASRDDVIGGYATAALGVLDALGVERATLAGYHTGASVALEAAVRAPGRVERLVLAGVFVVPQDDLAARAAWASRIVLPWEPDGRGDFVEWCRNWVRLYVPADDGEAWLRELIAFLQSRPANWWAHEAAIHYDVLGRLREVRCPVLFVNPAGKADYETTFEMTRLAHAALPGSAYAEVAGADGAPITHPAEFASAIARFARGG